jgi:XTP/dITP diphosphohydrolase
VRLTFVTGNRGKAAELAAILGPGFEVAQDARGYTEVQADTLDQVCEAGADELLAGGLAPPFVLEDSGLFVDALSGFPGVYSRHALDTLGLDGLLRLLAGVPPGRRGASFQADLLLVEADGRRRHFAGACRGAIAHEAAGEGGFGFDPVFCPEGEARTFAQMAPAEKAALSHRGQAVRALAAHLAGPGQTGKP